MPNLAEQVALELAERFFVHVLEMAALTVLPTLITESYRPGWRSPMAA